MNGALAVHVILTHTWPDQTTVDVHLDDDLAEYNPIRTSELCGLGRALLRDAVEDVESRYAEHDAEQ